MTIALTERQVEVLRWISSFTAAKGYPPTMREIGEGLGIGSTNGVADHLRAIESKGCLTTESLRSRAIVITETGAAVLRGETVTLTHHARRCSCGSVLEKRQRSLCIPCRIKADDTKRVAALVPKDDEPSPMSQRVEAALVEAERCVERVRAIEGRKANREVPTNKGPSLHRPPHGHQLR